VFVLKGFGNPAWWRGHDRIVIGAGSGGTRGSNFPGKDPVPSAGHIGWSIIGK